ncbi:MAG: TOBE domain-containing protein [Candidatus Thiodiazotropha sp.]|jgi:molybdate transport system regulatory protein
MPEQNTPILLGKLAVDTASGNFLGDTRIKLLEAIVKHGSISQAAKAVPLSYKAAWDAIDAMNNLAPEPLVIRTAGGKRGGGTELTDYGRRLISFYRALEQEYQIAVVRLSERMNEVAGNDVTDFRKVLRRLSMKASARNQFAGPVTVIKQSKVDCEVRIRLDDELELTAIITRESAENLGLKIGKEVTAFVKSSSIVLMLDAHVLTSARNRFCGVVTHIHKETVNAEVTITLPSDRHVVTAVITLESLEKHNLQVGSKACALFKASSVFLAVVE